MTEKIEQNNPDNNFKLWTKWFWIGIVMSIFNIVGGLVYGIALVLEKERRKEGTIIIIFTVAWIIFVVFLLDPQLKNWGVMPK